MKRLLVGLLLLFTPSCAAALVAPAKPFDTVRALADKDGKIMCSAVALAPDVAVTAAHCLEDIMTVDGIKVDNAVTVENRDVALLLAPGLDCPCATIGERPKKGDKAYAIGFPQGGPKRQTAPIMIVDIALVSEFAPWIQTEPFRNMEFIFSHDFVLIPGDSGGGLFNERGELIGTNSAMIFMPPYGFPYANAFALIDGVQVAP